MNNGLTSYYAMVGGLIILVLLALAFCVWVYWPTTKPDDQD